MKVAPSPSRELSRESLIWEMYVHNDLLKDAIAYCNVTSWGEGVKEAPLLLYY